MSLFCCRRDWYTSQNRWHHEEKTLCQNIKAASQDVSQAWAQIDLPENDPKHAAKLVTKWFKDNKVNVLAWPSQNLDLNLIDHWREEHDGQQTWQSSTRSVRRNGTKFRQTIVASFYRETQNHLLESRSLKTMLLNSKKMHGNMTLKKVIKNVLKNLLSQKTV